MASLIIKKSLILICVLFWMSICTTHGRSHLLNEESYFEESYSPSAFKPTSPTPQFGYPTTTKLPGGLSTKPNILKPIGVPAKGLNTPSTGLGIGINRNNSKPTKGSGVGTVGGRFEPTNGSGVGTVGSKPPTKGSGVGTVGSKPPTKGSGVGTVGGRFEPTNGTRLETVRGRHPARLSNTSGVETVGGHFEPTNAEDLETVRGHSASPTVSYQVDRRRRSVPESESSFSTTFGLRNKTIDKPSSIPASDNRRASPPFGSSGEGNADIGSGDEAVLNSSFSSSGSFNSVNKDFAFPSSGSDNRPLGSPSFPSSDPKVNNEEGSGSSPSGSFAPPNSRSLTSSSKPEPKLIFPLSGTDDQASSSSLSSSSSSASSSFGITGETVSSNFSTSSKVDGHTPDLGSDAPDLGSDAPDFGSDTPDFGSDAPDFGSVDEPSLQGRSYSSDTPLRNIRCAGVGEFANQPSKDKWCLNNCLHFPSYCPSQYCKCDYVD